MIWTKDPSETETVSAIQNQSNIIDFYSNYGLSWQNKMAVK